MKRSGLFSNSLCLMRTVLNVQSVQDILRAKSVIYYHYLLLSPSVDGMHACTYTSTLFRIYICSISSVHPSIHPSILGRIIRERPMVSLDIT